MNSTKYILEKSYIVATLFKVKEKYTKDRYVALNECQKFEEILLKELTSKNIKIEITKEIESNYFDIFDNIITKKAKEIKTIDSIIEEYKSNTHNHEITSILEDLEFIYNMMWAINEEKIDFIPAKIDNIIEKIIDNPTLFYEKITKCLSKEEQDYIKKFIIHKTCSNCDNQNCPNANFEKHITSCTSWRNNELIGKIKILTKNAKLN